MDINLKDKVLVSGSIFYKEFKKGEALTEEFLKDDGHIQITQKILLILQC